MKEFIALFKKVGGADVLKQYLRAHVFLFAMVQTLLQGFSRKGLEIVRLAVDNKVFRKLKKKLQLPLYQALAFRRPYSSRENYQ